MKKIISPSNSEVAEYFCDFTGKKLCSFGGIPIKITIDGGYRSQIDLCSYEFHCDDQFGEKLFDFIQKNLHGGKKLNEFAKYI